MGMTMSPVAEEVRYPDGRVSLARPDEIGGSRYANGDHGAYWYAGGWNWRAVAAFVAGALLAVGGAWSAPGHGPFPQDGLIPALKPLYNYNWVVGFAAALLVYLGLTAVSGARRPARTGPAI
jgi:cytosine/uracil/thiamine/allantoin permease